MPATYLGTGGYEGIAELKDQLKPLVYGNCRRIIPVCIDPELNLYQIHDGPIQDILAVFDAGHVLIQLLDCNDLLGWIPTTLQVSVGGYSADISRGIFRLACKPYGQITIDCIGSINPSYHGVNEGYWE